MPKNIENCAESPLDREVSPTASKNDRIPKKLLDKFTYLRLFGILGICLVTLLIIIIKMQFGQNISQNIKAHIFQSIVDLADSGSEKLSLLKIPEISEISSCCIIIQDLGVIMEKSDIMVKNGKKISEVLFGLDKEIRKAGDEFEEFWHQAKSFYFSLANEMKTIMEEIKKSPWLEYGFFKYFIKSNNHMSNSEADFISKRLEVLEKQIPGFMEQLKQVLAAIDSVHNSADNAQGYLIDGEREAEHALKKHWLGNIADYTMRKRAEDELLQVRIIIKILKEIAPSLINFETFLKEYHRRIKDVAKKVKNVPIKPTAKDMKYLKKAIADLEEQHTQFSSEKNQFIFIDAYNTRYFEENQTLEEQCIKFSSEEYKPVNTYENIDDIKDNKNVTNDQHTKFSSEEYKPVDTYEDIDDIKDNEDVMNNQHTKFHSEEYKPVDTYEDIEDIKDNEDMTNDQNYNYSMFYACLK
ncbi:22031_t:CDS:2 [Gigaspora margarita]|uniref:22031_t:CDS:1 n=1 Tax=Gigaspora margarita TaxID=4874 RepID=A0ABN7VD41_GIGMA|nr:22031_t:CDS:2 [Gigaspora margarita]